MDKRLWRRKLLVPGIHISHSPPDYVYDRNVYLSCICTVTPAEVVVRERTFHKPVHTTMRLCASRQLPSPSHIQLIGTGITESGLCVTRGGEQQHFQTNISLSEHRDCFHSLLKMNRTPDDQNKGAKNEKIEFSLFYLRELDMSMVRSASATNNCLRVCVGKDPEPKKASQNITMSSKVED